MELWLYLLIIQWGLVFFGIVYIYVYVNSKEKLDNMSKNQAVFLFLCTWPISVPLLIFTYLLRTVHNLLTK
jgi:hypothetical protein